MTEEPRGGTVKRIISTTAFRTGSLNQRDIKISQLQIRNLEDVAEVFRAIDQVAQKNDIGGFTNFHEGTADGEKTLACYFLPPGSGAYRTTISAKELGGPQHDAWMLYRKIAAKAEREGAIAMYPTFQQDTVGGELVYGAIVLKGENFVPFDFVL